ncbi:hypothetical protein SNEBB_007187 [Seison nebaliae]|nr:hypothetical protein SNEBB_007187 [Seison nebaliae]
MDEVLCKLKEQLNLVEKSCKKRKRKNSSKRNNVEEKQNGNPIVQLSYAQSNCINHLAFKGLEIYKSIVVEIELFILEHSVEYSLAGLYIIDGILKRALRRLSGTKRDLFSKEFGERMDKIWPHAITTCSSEQLIKVRRLFDIWKRHNMFQPQVIALQEEILNKRIIKEAEKVECKRTFDNFCYDSEDEIDLKAKNGRLENKEENDDGDNDSISGNSAASFNRHYEQKEQENQLIEDAMILKEMDEITKHKDKTYPPTDDDHVYLGSRTIWIGRIPKICEDCDISELLTKLETKWEKIKIVHPRGCAYVTLKNREDVRYLLNKKERLKIRGGRIRVDWAKPNDNSIGRWFSEYGLLEVPTKQLSPFPQQSLNELEKIARKNELDLYQTSLPKDILKFLVKKNRQKIREDVTRSDSPKIEEPKKEIPIRLDSLPAMEMSDDDDTDIPHQYNDICKVSGRHSCSPPSSNTTVKDTQETNVVNYSNVHLLPPPPPPPPPPISTVNNTQTHNVIQLRDEHQSKPFVWNNTAQSSVTTPVVERSSILPLNQQQQQREQEQREYNNKMEFMLKLITNQTDNNQIQPTLNLPTLLGQRNSLICPPLNSNTNIQQLAIQQQLINNNHTSSNNSNNNNNININQYQTTSNERKTMMTPEPNNFPFPYPLPNLSQNFPLQPIPQNFPQIVNNNSHFPSVITRPNQQLKNNDIHPLTISNDLNANRNHRRFDNNHRFGPRPYCPLDQHQHGHMRPNSDLPSPRSVNSNRSRPNNQQNNFPHQSHFPSNNQRRMR